MAEDYWKDLYDDPYAVKRIEKSLELADISSGMTVLDVGCHQGELETFMPIETQYHGIDLMNGFNIDGGFTLSLKFDRILCFEVLEHLMNPEGTLESVKTHLKDDGLAIISLPNEATIFHRLRGLLGVMDGECFGSSGKHLHLPSLKQSKAFIGKHLRISSVHYYISPAMCGSRQAKLGRLAKLFPDLMWQLLADVLPALFARGFIFVCRKVD